MEKRELTSMFFMSPVNIQYLTGFFHVQIERPTGLLIPLNGEPQILTCKLEEANLKDRAPWVRCETVYFDYPGEKHPLIIFSEYLKEIGSAKGRIGFDHGAFQSSQWTYEKSSPVEIFKQNLKDAHIELARDIVDKMRIIKDDEEIALIREATRWGNLAMSLVQRYIEPGVSEGEISLRAEYEASKAMLQAMPPLFEPFGSASGPAHVFIRSGPRAMLSHRSPSNRKIQKGDVIFANASGNVYGYVDEVERTFMVGKPTPKMERYFRIARSAQESAIELLRPGNICGDVDNTAREVFRKAGVMKYLIHHTGHGMGLQRHEPPHLDVGDRTIIQERMEFAVEPKIYDPTLGSFGHSDTVLVTKDGPELLTYYPRDLESCTID